MKYRYLSIFLLILILSVGAVCAQDNSTDESSFIASSSDDVISVDSNIDVLQDNESEGLKTFSIDDNNFNNYFDENGSMLESANISDYSVILLGNISNHVMVFDKILTIIPNNDSVLTNVGITFIAGSDNSTIRGLTFQNTNAVTALNVSNANDIAIANNIISVSSQDTNGLIAFAANYTKNLIFSSNSITYSGKSNGTIGKYYDAIRIINSENALIEDNFFNINVSSVDVHWDEIPPASGNYVRDSISGGIVVIDSNNVTLSENVIFLNATDIVTAYGFDTIYVVDVDSNNTVIDNNNIVAKGKDYIYGIIVSGNNFTISNNDIIAESDYYVNGIDVEGPAIGTVKNNTINISAPTSAYGIYAAMSNGNVSVDYTNNIIHADSYAAFGMELGGIDANVFDNIIELTGNYTTAIAAKVTKLAAIGNNITSTGSGNGNMYVWDELGVENVGIKLLGGLALIEENKINATGKGIVASNVNLTIKKNDIFVGDTGLADSYAISVSDCVDVDIIENYVDFTGKTNSTFVNNALYVTNSAVETIEENTFEIAIPSVDVNWREDPPASGTWVSSPVSEGIVFKNVTDLQFMSNTIYLNATDVITAYGYDTIYVVDVDSDNAVIDSNSIYAMGKDYIYGIIIKGENFTISNNFMEIESDSNYANGIDIEPASSGVVNNNEMLVMAPNVVYGIYAAMYWETFTYSDAIEYTNNYIVAESDAVYAMSLYGSEANIADNTIEANGNYTLGILTFMMDDIATFTGNQITVNGLKNGTAKTGDMVDAQTVGILTMGKSQIHKNIINSAGNFTVINSASDSEITYNYLVSKELLGDDSVHDTLDDSLVENNIPIEGANNYNLTNDTFFLFFDEEGNLRENITSESLTFIGEFSEVGPWITIDRPIKLLSDNATLNDISFRITSDNVTVDRFKFISEDMANLIEIFMANNVSIINNNFNVTGVEDDYNVVIAIIGSDNVKIDENAINFTVITNGTFKNAAVYAFESEDLIISNNYINASLPARSINWTSGEVYSEGVFMGYCNNAFLYNNTVAVTSNDKIGEYDTIYAVHINGDNATFNENSLGVVGAPYGYGLVITGENFNITDNSIYAVQNGTYACGLDVESNSNGIIDNLRIVAAAENSAYGIYTANWAGDVKVNITNSTIIAAANSPFALSLSGSEVLVENNTIWAFGNFTTGIAAAVDDLLVSNNTIRAGGSNEGTPLGYDTMGIETTGVHIVKGNAIVKNNNITSTGEFAVDAKGTGSVTDNYLISANYAGDAAVDVNVGDTIVSNNTPVMQRVIIQAEDVVMYYKNGTRYVLKVTDMSGNPLANENVTLTINGASYNRVTDENGTASIAINLNPGNYTGSVSYVGTGNCTNSTIENTITVLSTIYGDDLVKMFRNASQYYATFLDGQGNPLAAGTNVTFNINGVFYTRQINGSEGKAKLNINLEAGEYIITAYHPLNNQTYSNNITVLSIIANNTDLVKYYKNGSQYVVTILGADGKAVGAGENVTFNINGVMYTRQTNASGQAKLNINLEPGNYTITAMYNGCMVSNNIEVLPILYAQDLVKKYGTSDQFRALLLDGQGNPFPNQNITFNINGVFYNRLTNADGYAALNIRLGAAKDVYIITSSYNGTSISNTITITD